MTSKLSFSDINEISSLEVAERISELALSAVRNQIQVLNSVATLITQTIVNEGKIFTFGAGHAQAFAMELSSRAGGLANFVSMHLQDIRKNSRDAFWDLRDSAPERLPENGPLLLDHHKVTQRDLVIIASQSGRNGAIIEMALECKRRGIPVVGVSSLEHSSGVDSRHPSGLMLFEVVDHFIDNGSVLGDAVAILPNGKSICSASTVCFALIAQVLNAEISKKLLQEGYPLPTLVSANLDHGDQVNAAHKRETPPNVG